MARTDPGDAMTLGDVILHYRPNTRAHMREEREMSSPVVTRHLLRAMTLGDANFGSLENGLNPFPHGLSAHYARASRDPFT